MEAKVGLRDRNKQQKLARISQAAWELFEANGFEATTTRQIAERAEVATGTLFLYVQNKYDLLVLIYNEAIEQAIETAFARLRPDLSLLDELTQVFAIFLQLYNRNLPLARFYIQALLFQSGSNYRRQGTDQINRFLHRLAGRIEEHQAAGRLSAEVEPMQAAANFFALYYSVLTGFVSGLYDLETAINGRLRPAFQLQIEGLN